MTEHTGTQPAAAAKPATPRISLSLILGLIAIAAARIVLVAGGGLLFIALLSDKDLKIRLLLSFNKCLSGAGGESCGYVFGAIIGALFPWILVGIGLYLIKRAQQASTGP